MMNIKERIAAIAKAGETIKLFLSNFSENQEHELIKVIDKSYQQNKWFTVDNQKMALQNIIQLLDIQQLGDWMANYQGLLQTGRKPKTIGIIMAGNIPLVGFHDLLCVLISGNRALIRQSSDDQELLPYFCRLLTEINPEFADLISISDRISNIDAVIATGSNNSARYFDYYFAKYPHVIRKNRNAVAVLTGNESTEELQLLGKDIFSYFGMGCRNVSKLYLPRGYDLKNFFPALEKYTYLTGHAKYMSNYDYNSAVLLLKKVPFLTNDFLIVIEDKSFSTPVAVLHYEFYDDLTDVVIDLNLNQDKIQCIIANPLTGLTTLPFGASQIPGLMDYADGVDVLKFLEKLG